MLEQVMNGLIEMKGFCDIFGITTIQAPLDMATSSLELRHQSSF
jgi:hypothetical protein